MKVIALPVHAPADVPADEASYFHLQSYVPGGLFRVDRGGRIVHATAALSEMLGYSQAAELVGRSLGDLCVDANDGRRWLQGLERDEVVRDFETEMCRRDGSVLSVRIAARAFRDRGGEIAYCEGFIDAIDASSQKRAEAAVRESEEKFRQIFESSLDAVAINDAAEGTYLEVNHEFLRLTGFTRDEVLGRSPVALGLWADRGELALAVKEIETEGVIRNREARLCRKDGSVRWALFSALRVNLGTRPSILSFTRDITELKQGEAELQGALDKVRDSDRLKSAFLANISHEIRTPLNIISGYSGLIADHLAATGDDSQQDFFAAIDRAGKRLITTVHAILDISKLETGSFEITPSMVSVPTLVTRVIHDFQPLAKEKGLTLSYTIEEPQAGVRFDSYCLTQALDKLVDNAIKFTDTGGVALRLYRNRNGLCLEVRDTGIGIDKSYLPLLFERFSQEESGYTRPFEGSGLGMALAKGYLELNRARISVESEKGKGTVFLIEFPREDELGETTQTLARELRPRVASSTRKPLLLVVEDDPDSQALMKTILSRDYAILTAATAPEARAALAAHTGEICMILMDLSLNGPEDGLMLTTDLRRQAPWKHVPILATTAHALPEDEKRALAAGCNGYLVKPFRRQQLLATIEKLLR